MLKLFYDQDIDYLEVFFQKTSNYGDETEKGIITFKNEKNDKIVGYGFHKPAKVILNSFLLSPKTKIAVMCFIKRKQIGLSERELASRLNLSYRTYQHGCSRDAMPEYEKLEPYFTSVATISWKAYSMVQVLLTSDRYMCCVCFTFVNCSQYNNFWIVSY